MGQTSTHSYDQLRSVISELWKDDPEYADLKNAMLAKFDSFISGQRHAYRRYTYYKRVNFGWVAVIVLIGGLVPASAIVPFESANVFGVTLRPEHVTGLLGILLSSLIAMHQSINPHSRQMGYLEMSNRYKNLRDKVALKVRDRSAFESLLEENDEVRMRWTSLLPAADVVLN